MKDGKEWHQRWIRGAKRRGETKETARQDHEQIMELHKEYLEEKIEYEMENDRRDHGQR